MTREKGDDLTSGRLDRWLLQLRAAGMRRQYRKLEHPKSIRRNAAMEDTLIPISILTGFLGSGKTTILNRLLTQPGAERTAVVINEFGEIGIDHDLIEVDTKEDLVLMNSGCLCCTIRGDLSDTLMRLHERRGKGRVPRFDRVIVETTGLADPSPILHTLVVDDRLYRTFRLDGVIAAVDAVNGAGTLDRQEEAVRQAAVADRLFITKADLATRAQLDRLRARLHGLNPAASKLAVHNGDVRADDFYGLGLFDPKTKSLDVQRWLQAEAFDPGLGEDGDHHHRHHHGHDHAHHDHAHHDEQGNQDVNRHGENIRAFCVTYDVPIAPMAFDAWLEMLMLIRGPDFLRMKGIVNVEGMTRPVVVHGVQHVFSPPVALPRWPSGDRRTRIVFITRNVSREQIEDTLKVFAAVVSADPSVIHV